MLEILLLFNSFACWICFHVLLSAADLFQNQLFFKTSFYTNTIRVPNSLDPDQDRHNVGPDLGHYCLQMVFSRGQKPLLARTQTRGEFNNWRARGRSSFWYLSLFVMCKARHQYNEHLKALTLFNWPLILALAGALCTDARLYPLRIKIGTRTTSPSESAGIIELASCLFTPM